MRVSWAIEKDLSFVLILRAVMPKYHSRWLKQELAHSSRGWNSDIEVLIALASPGLFFLTCRWLSYCCVFMRCPLAYVLSVSSSLKSYKRALIILDQGPPIPPYFTLITFTKSLSPNTDTLLRSAGVGTQHMNLRDMIQPIPGFYSKYRESWIGFEQTSGIIWFMFLKSCK